MGKLFVKLLESDILKDNPLGDPFEREVLVYLPDGYESNDSQYPTIYFLPGFAGTARGFFNDSPFAPNIGQRIDKMIADERIDPFIAVFPDCMTRYGGSQFINSSATGNYEDYLIDEVVPFVDDHFPTQNDPNKRAVAGISSGGYGSLVMALRHSDTFRLAASIAGDCYFEMCYKPDFGKAFHAIRNKPLRLVEKFYDELANKGRNAFDGLNIIGMSSCYSPNPESEWGFDLPFDPETGILRQDVWERWLRNDPVELVEESLDSLNAMKLIYIDAGKSDEFNLDIGARALRMKLEEFSVRHVSAEFDGGHFSIKHRYEPALEAISKAFDQKS